MIHNAVNYKKEASFALQILNANSFLMGVALGDQDSLKNAIINVAAIGLSLSPLMKLAYLIPRKNKVCLDISYLGYIDLAVSVGAIKWAQAEVVRDKDVYVYKGMGQMPLHEFDPFSDRGEVKGVYCVAKTHDGEFILTQMSNEQVWSIRDRSESYMAWVRDNSKSTPWKTDIDEMIKKTCIRRAYKSWPKSSTKSDDRFERAIDVSNEVEFSETQDVPLLADSKGEHIATIRDYLTSLNRTEEKYIAHLVRVNRRDIKSLQDLTEIEMNQAIIMLDQLVEAQKAKEKLNEKIG